MPPPVHINSSLSDEGQVNIDVSWNDLQEQYNYYRIIKQSLIIAQSDTIVDNTQASVYDLVKEETDGQELLFHYSGRQGSSYRGVNIYLINSDEHYYNYCKSIKTYFSHPNANSIYSNIKGGKGIFCSYQKSYKRLLF